MVFSRTHGTVFRKGHRAGFNKLKVRILQTVFSDHNGMKLENNNRRKFGGDSYM